MFGEITGLRSDRPSCIVIDTSAGLLRCETVADTGKQLAYACAPGLPAGSEVREPSFSLAIDGEQTPPYRVAVPALLPRAHLNGHAYDRACYAAAVARLGVDCVVCAQPTLQLERSNTKVAASTEYEGVKIRRVRAIGSHRNLFIRMAFAVSYLLATFVYVARSRKELDGIVITTNPPFLGLAGRLAKALFGLRYVVIVYDVYPDIASGLGMIRRGGVLFRLWDLVTKSFLRAAERVIVIGRDMRDLIDEKLGTNGPELVIIPNWSDETLVHPIDKAVNPFRSKVADRGDFVVQYSGRMARSHNIEPVLQAAALLGERPVVFQMIGDGAKKGSLQALSNDLGLQNVQFLAYQPRAELPEVLSAADISVVCLDAAFTGISVPSKAYGIMAAGTAMLALVEEASEIGKVVREYDCGVVLADPSPSELAAVIAALIDDPIRLARLGSNARDAFLEHFTLALAAKRYHHVLREVFD